MLRAAGGDADAMGLLFRHAYGDVRSLCARLTDVGEADDLAQETFLRALRSARTFRGDARFSTWIYRIARNVCNDHLGVLARQRARAAQAIAREPAVNGASDPDRTEILRRSLEKLSRDDREAVVLSRLRDLTYRELGEILECSEGAARVRVHRALARLREIIREEYPDGFHGL